MLLVLPIAGKSSRFKDVRPKWMLTHPCGELMLTRSIMGLNIKSFSKILIIALKEHEDTYGFSNALVNEISSVLSFKKEDIILILLDKPTNSQSETVYEGLIKSGFENDSIFIKDCDNFYKLKIDHDTDCNFIVCVHLSEAGKTLACNKSYVQIGNNNTVMNIAEKKVISDLFCCGGYFFSSGSEFIATYLNILENFNSKELFISHIIYKMLLDKKTFFIKEASDYIDWGTFEDWMDYKKKYTTVFIDLDGVLVKNSGEHFSPIWGTTDGIQENIDAINNMYNRGYTEIIITTSRKESFRDITVSQLKRNDIKYHRLVMGLFATKRILINDFSTTNAYPTSISINLKRNANNLKDYL